MSGSRSPPSPRARNSEGKLYQACLEACIQGIEKLPVSKRRRRSATADQNNSITSTVANDVLANPSLARAATPPVHYHSTAVLISPPQTPTRATLRSQAHSSEPAAIMNRDPLYGTPGRGALPTFGMQDARGNFAVQPATNSGSMKLKKAAVKIVGAAPAPAPSTLSRAGTPAVSTSSAPDAKPKEAKRPDTEKVTAKLVSPTTAPASLTTTTELSEVRTKEESALDDLFAKLSAQETTVLGVSIKKESPTSPKDAQFSFDESPRAHNAPASESSSYTANLSGTAGKPDSSLSGSTIVNTQHQKNKVSQHDVQLYYMWQAYAYLQALPSSKSVTLQTLKAVLLKLRSCYVPSINLGVGDVEKLIARYAFAIVNYVNKIYKKSAKTITTEYVKKSLKENDGNMLGVFAKLVEDEYLLLDDMDSCVGLCKMILDALPLSGSAAVSTTSDAPEETECKPMATTTPSGLKLGSHDPVESMKTWPAQEKRENPPAYRACILKGVSGVKSINQLQALVWGGRLEAVAMPSPGSDFAVVRFLEPKACDKYFSATENGIEVQGDKKSIVFVEKQPGPTSINDVMRNCIEGDASRCVRALDAEDDWSDILLMKLARGKGASKREVDRIKQGKTARGRHYIEFRFASIYHALQFKRQLTDDPDWEHCTISYATDPCETAEGIHYKDADEE